jgi:SAM-dependent methyltransferase
MDKLNFGCGTRIAPGWTNIDFQGVDGRVWRVNLLAGFPFPANHFDVVYSSHVLEHFTLEEAASLLREAQRVLKPGGVIRTVVPDLEDAAREYLRILSLPDSDADKPQLYEWIKIELLDQLTRSSPGGAMGRFIRAAKANGDIRMLNYIRSRIESGGWTHTAEERRKSLIEKLKMITPEKLSTKLVYCYLSFIKSLIPGHIRSMVVNETSIGERHRWMYDRYGLRLLMESTGFVDVSFCCFNESTIPGFVEDRLDSNMDGSAYKNGSIFCEAKKGIH